ncbi:MAG: hypothetical protein Q4D16_10660 [Eubacteriales bacterium]|nr:hypothetical protein [Eubacteriales bacterium]
MSPQEVLQAEEEMGTEWLIPVHWGGFVLYSHAWDKPAERLTILAAYSDISVSTPRIGVTISFDDIEQYQ